MKLYILGAAGSGKSTYAKKLAAELKVPYFDLDDAKWINDDGKHYCKSRDYDERARIISEIITGNKSWVCEGVYYQDWMDKVFEKADEVIILQTPRWLCQWRCFIRAIKRYNKKTTSFRSVYDLLRWNHDYYSKYLPIALEKMQNMSVKYRFLNPKQIDNSWNTG
ncbi:MAG: hypothetical protein LBF37_03045 [Rickettsiales bacterium]|jgi:adenylate kinase family enzyme|nr:hypothetical protein [Rickettsiales bacterium]